MRGHSVRRSSAHRSLAHFRPRLESLERRVLLAADWGSADVTLVPVLADQPAGSIAPADEAILTAFDSSYPDDVTVQHRQRLFVNDRPVAELAVVTRWEAAPGQSAAEFVITSFDPGRLTRHTQAIDSVSDFADFSSFADIGSFGSFSSFGDLAGEPAAPEHPTMESERVGSEVLTIGSGSLQAVPLTQSVATRYSLARNEESLDFTVRQLAVAELLEPGAEAAAVVAADLDDGATKAAGVYDALDGITSEDTEDPWSQTELPPRAGDLRPIDALPPLFPSAACPVPALTVASAITAQSGDRCELLDAVQAYRSSSPNGEADGQAAGSETDPPRWLSQVMVQVTKAGRASQLPLNEWIDVFVGNPVDRLSMLNGFDIFQELQLDRQSDQADRDPHNGLLTRLLPWSVLVTGLSLSAMAVLRSHRPRRRRVAHDRIFANETLLAETLGL
ncbi:hypothetical protein [Roseimaritima sediminicola]|uniref:hypothetical protein n=1 Tax=Roseimaritima sediminicola TaxID=2662066 RepID=UPI0012984563|nr:hypothetical protein [Roseimaritima sediminicola]